MRVGSGPHSSLAMTDSKVLSLQACLEAAVQITMLFQSAGFTVRNGDCLIPANALLDLYERHHEPATTRKR